MYTHIVDCPRECVVWSHDANEVMKFGVMSGRKRSLARYFAFIKFIYD